MLKTYKYRLYPNQKQQGHFNRSFGCVRWIYNQALQHKNEVYRWLGKSLSYVDLCNGLLKQRKAEFEWLQEPTAQCLQQSLRNLDTAFQNFFKKTARFPRFKSKHDHHYSLIYPQYVKLDFKNGKIQIPKVGPVFAVLHRKFDGKVRTCTVSKTPSGKFFISVLVDDGAELSTKPPVLSETALGIDLGLTHFAILDDGTKIENPRFLEHSLQRLAVLQRRLSRKQKGSKNRNKARLKVARQHEYIANQRKDFLHQLTSQLIKSDNQTLIIENLAVKNMVKIRSLAKSISDVGWGIFKEFLTYKTEWYGKNIIVIDRFDPSSKRCSHCGEIYQDLSLKEREWTCDHCGTKHDRDISAAKNIKYFGLVKVQTGQELPEEPTEMLRRQDLKVLIENEINEVGNSVVLE